ncbi:MAG: NADH-quinone oxidoreductase subunit C [Candidatus Eremiobacteraeota bacterium]|nr:NADH-quinone oxidoreductase subunit C [Candidatus Eremiobacteraeota bacterium]
MPEAASARALTAALLTRLPQLLGSSFLEAVSEDDMDEAAILGSGLLPAVDAVRDAGFNHLLDIGGTDHLPLTPRFEISYHFLAFTSADIQQPGTTPAGTTPGRDGSFEQKKSVVPARFRLRVFPDDLNPVLPSLYSRWPNADWPERELYDLFGVRFEGHPDLRRILMPDDWKGYPLRKDYPLRGLERRFAPGGLRGEVPPVINK